MATEARGLGRAFERAYAWLAAPRDSLPACAARAGLGAFVLLPAGHVALGKLSQAVQAARALDTVRTATAP